MSVAVSPVCGSGAPLRVRGRRRSRMSTIALAGRSGRPAATLGGRGLDGLAQLLGREGRARRQRERQLRERPAVLGLALADDDLGRHVGVVDGDDLGVARGPRGRGCRRDPRARVGRRARTHSVEPAGGQRAGELHPALLVSCARRRQVPVLDHFGARRRGTRRCCRPIRRRGC